MGSARQRSEWAKGSTKYAKTPDSLLGFRKDTNPLGNRPFSEQSGAEYKVKVDAGGGNVWEDGIKGRNAEHALERAKRNWPGAKIAIKGLGKSLLSPAGLAEDVAAGAVSNAKQIQFKKATSAQGKTNPKTGLKNPTTKA